MGVKIADKLEQYNNGTYYLVDSSAVEYVDKDGNSQSVKDILDNGIGEGNTTDLTDIENRITTNETNITGLQDQIDNLDIPDLTDLENRVTTNETNITGLQEQIDNLDIPEDVDLTEINDKLTQLETKTASSILKFPYWNGDTDTYLQIPAPTTLSKQSAFITITSSQGGCIVLLAGDSISEYSLTKCIRLSHDNIWSHDATDAGTEKLLNVYVDKSNGYIYVKLAANGSVSITGINEAPVSVTTLPTDVIKEIPIVDLTQGSRTDLTGINTKLSQLETKANLIPVVADNPTDYDLNNYRENGNYSIGDSSKYSNVPIAQPALLTVIRSNSYRLQIYTIVNNDDVYFRKSTDWGSTWSSWVLLNGSSGADIAAINTKLTQLENTVNQVGGGGIYTSGEAEVGKWINGQTLYRTTLAANKSMTITSTSQGGFETLVLGNINPSRYRVVKLEGSFKYVVNNSNSKTCVLPCAFADNDMVMNMVHSSTTGDVILQGKNMPVCDITDIYVSIYYYKN